MMSACLFAILIYGYFSGYSDVAIGLGKLFGFQMRKNLNVPFFSRNMSEVWTRWYISLSSWFRDYLYIPLGGNRDGRVKRIRNILLVFAISGLWHGANWTFICWGLAKGFLVVLAIMAKRTSFPEKIAYGKMLPSF